MESLINIKYRWTEEEMAALSRYLHQASTGPKFHRLFQAAAVLMFVSGVFYLATGRSSAFGIISIASAIYWLFFHPFMLRWLVRRQFDKHPERGQEIEWQISPDRLFVRDGLGQSEFKWEALTKIVRTPGGFIFYSTDSVYCWLPHHGFTDTAGVERLSALAKSKVQQYADIA